LLRLLLLSLAEGKVRGEDENKQSWESVLASFGKWWSKGKLWLVV